MSNRLDSDQARRFDGPELGPICLQRFSADDTRRQSVKTNVIGVIFLFAPGYLIIYKYMMICPKLK